MARRSTSRAAPAGQSESVSFAYVDGEALLLSMKRPGRQLRQRLHVGQSGTEPRAASLGPGRRPGTRASLRFGLGRFNTAEEVEFAISTVAATVGRLRQLSSLA